MFAFYRRSEMEENLPHDPAQCTKNDMDKSNVPVFYLQQQ